MNTGHPIVDEVTTMRFEGIKIDHRWLGHPFLCRDGKRVQAGKSTGFQYEAAYVLAEILYFYSARIERDPEGHIVSVTKRFDGAVMYQDYEVWAKKLGLTKYQLQDIIAFLKQQGLIRSWAEPVVLRSGTKTNNLPHFEPVVEKIWLMTYGPTEASENDPQGVSKIGEAPRKNFKSRQNGAGVSPKSAKPIAKITETSTVSTCSTFNTVQQQQPETEIEEIVDVDDVVESSFTYSTPVLSHPNAADATLTERNAASIAADPVQHNIDDGFPPLPGTTLKPTHQHADLITRLHRAGLSQVQAEECVTISAPMCEAQLAELPHREIRKASARGGVLYQSIKQGWATPYAAEQREAREAAERAANEKAEQEASQQLEAAQRAANVQKVAAAAKSLSAPQLEFLEREGKRLAAKWRWGIAPPDFETAPIDAALVEAAKADLLLKPKFLADLEKIGAPAPTPAVSYGEITDTDRLQIAIEQLVADLHTGTTHEHEIENDCRDIYEWMSDEQIAHVVETVTEQWRDRIERAA